MSQDVNNCTCLRSECCVSLGPKGIPSAKCSVLDTQLCKCSTHTVSSNPLRWGLVIQLTDELIMVSWLDR